MLLAILLGGLGALEGPEEERGQPRVLLQRAGGGVAAAEHLLQRGVAHHLPDLLQVLWQADLAALGGLHYPVAAEDLERWHDAGEDQVGAANALALQTLEPGGDAGWELAQDIGPVADWGVLGPRTTDEVDAGGQ